MIHVDVNMHGELRRFLPDGAASLRLTLPDETRVADLLERLQAQHDVWLAAIDNVAVPLSARLNDGAAIDFFPHMEGG